MFLPTDNSKNPPTLPRNCTFSESDWQILAGFWHPVAFLNDIANDPVSSTLLDEKLVIYRTSEGVNVAKDLCMHRGTRISLGSIRQDRLICPMHGLEFDWTGQCRKIPSLVDQTAAIPRKLCLRKYLSTERYGILWVCLKNEPIHPLPEWPELEQKESEYERIDIPLESAWNASASRQTENFIDIAHHPFVHLETFGNPNETQIEEHVIEKTTNGLKLHFRRNEMERGWHDPSSAGERLTDYIYDLTFPFAKDLFTEGVEDGIKCHFYDIASPVSANRTEIFQINLTNNLFCSREEFSKYQLVTNEEDRQYVEAQCPEEVPLDLRQEIHTPSDRFSIEYRRALVEKFGLGSPYVG